MSGEYIAVAKGLLARSEANKDKYKGDCSSCKWSVPGLISMGCTNPMVEVAARSVDQGYGRDRVRECDTQRAKRSPFGPVVCGPDGELWEMGVAGMGGAPTQIAAIFAIAAFAVICIILIVRL